MKQRDITRNMIKKSKDNEKIILNNKYKLLRNKVTCQIRKENQDFNNNRINEAKSEGELWKVANDVIKPKSDESMKLNLEGSLEDTP